MPGSNPAILLGEKLRSIFEKTVFCRNSRGSMSLRQQQSSITQGGTDVIEDLPSVKECICRLCGVTFSEEKFLTNHVNYCKYIENPDDSLVINPTTVKKEEMDSPELVDDQVTYELTLVDIKEEKVEFTDNTVTAYGESIDSRKAETPKEAFLYSEHSYAAAQATHLKERVEVCKPEMRYKCNNCDYATTQPRYLKAHKQRHARQKSLTAGKGAFKCTICEYTCKRNNCLTLHMRTHTGEKPFKCTLCDYASVDNTNLTRHMRTHTGVKPFKCLLCDYTCARTHHLICHNMSKHSGEKPFKCTLCDYASVSKDGLTVHARMHSGEKPFKCTVCDYSSTYQSCLIQHMRTHTGEKPFKCILCDYAGARNDNLICHMSKHSGEKSYKCTLCDYASANRDSLRVHIRRMHTTETI